MAGFFELESSGLGSRSSDPVMAAINGTKSLDEIRLANNTEFSAETADIDIEGATPTVGEDLLLVPQNAPEVLNLGKDGSELGKDPLTGETEDSTVGEADPLTGSNTDEVEIETRARKRDKAGNNLKKARNLGVLTDDERFREFVGKSDRKDFYKFRVKEKTDVDIELRGLSGNADLYLLNNRGRVIDRSAKGGKRAEDIERTLNPGAYYVRVQPKNRRVNANYTLSLGAELPDVAGNTRGKAHNLGVLRDDEKFQEFVGKSDRKDFYKFRVNEKTDVDIELRGLSGNADLYLLNNRGKVLAKSAKGGKAAEDIERTLNPGAYYVRVQPKNRRVNANYSLSLDAESPDVAGNTRGKAHNLGVLKDDEKFKEFVGKSDSKDFYKFKVNEKTDVDIELRGLSGNADLYLLNNKGKVLAKSAKGGKGAEDIERTLNPGNYYVRVQPKNRRVNADYDLSFEAEKVVVQPTPTPTPEPVVQPTPTPTPEPVVQPTPTPTPEPVVQPTPTPTPEPVVQPTPTPTPEPVAVQPTPTPTPEPVAVQPTPTPTPEPVAVQPTPTPTPEPVAVQPTPTPTPEPVAVQPTPTPTPEPVAVQPTPTPTPDPVVVQPTPAPTPDPVVVQPTPAPTPEPVAVQPTPAPTPEPVAVQPTPAPTPEPVAVQPTPAPTPEPVAVQPTPAPTPEPVAVQPTPAPTPEPVAVLAVSAGIEPEDEPVLAVSAGIEPEDETEIIEEPPANEREEWQAWVSKWDPSSGALSSVNVNENTSLELVGQLNLGSNISEIAGDGRHGINNADWGAGSVKGYDELPTDNFLVKAYTEVDLEGGQTYEFEAKGDDGYQIWLKNLDTNEWRWVTPENEWQNTVGQAETDKFTHTIPIDNGGRYYVGFFHSENTGDAYFGLNWKEAEDEPYSIVAPKGKFVTVEDSNGNLQAFGIGQDNEVWQWREDDGNLTQWYKMGLLAKELSVIETDDGNIEVFGIGTDDNAWQWREDDGNLTQWYKMGLLAKELNVIETDDGSVEVFGIATDDKAWQWRENDGNLTQWYDMGLLAKELNVIETDDGSVEVFGIATDDKAWQWRENDGNLTQWYDMGLLAKELNVIETDDGSVEVFGIATDDKAWQWRENDGNLTQWYDMGLLAKELNVIETDDGSVEVFGIATDDKAWQWRENDGNLTQWYDMGLLAKELNVIETDDGSVEVFGIATDDKAWQWRENDGNLTQWYDMGLLAKELNVIETDDGSVEVFGIATDDKAWQWRENDGNLTQWYDMGLLVLEEHTPLPDGWADLHSNATESDPLKGFQSPVRGGGWSISQAPGGELSHHGHLYYAIDINKPQWSDFGEPVYAMRPGTVKKVVDYHPDVADPNRTNLVEIQHDNGYIARYLHFQQDSNSDAGLQVGQKVDAGQMIGRVGNSGWSTGPHLHVDVGYYEGGSFTSKPFEIEGIFSYSSSGDGGTSQSSGSEADSSQDITGNDSNQDIESQERLLQILEEYRVQNVQEMVGYTPVPLFGEQYTITPIEKKMLEELYPWEKLAFGNIKDTAESKAKEIFPSNGTDGHEDAFRHAYWNSLLTKEFGENWAYQFTTAHEAVPLNPKNIEAMDLYNNEKGRKIATNSDKEDLANLVKQAIDNGELIVLDKDGNLAWSNEVTVGEHGSSNGAEITSDGWPIPDGNAQPR